MKQRLQLDIALLAVALLRGVDLTLAENDLGQSYVRVQEIATPLRPFRLEEVRLRAALTFQTRGQTRDITFVPLNSIRPEVWWRPRGDMTHFGVYWMVFRDPLSGWPAHGPGGAPAA